MPSTRYLRVDPVHPDPARVQLAAGCLRTGGLVAFPTETVYGLGANALDPAAVRSIFRAKGRPASDPLIVHLPGLAKLEAVAAAISPLAEALAAAFWPGPLTLVLPRHARLPAEVVAGGATVAVRVPDHAVAQALLAAADVPIAAPSANRFGRPSPTTAQHVLDDLEGEIDVVLDAGPVSIGLESTILDVTQNPPVILRPGGLPLEAIRRIAPEVRVRARYLSPDADLASAPGQFLKHYSPHAELRLLDGPRAAVLAHMRTLIQACQAAGQATGILILDEDADAFRDLPVEVARLGPAADLEAVSRRLFAAVRDLDQRGVRVILARVPARTGLGLAIWDRLYRAAEGRVIDVKG